MNGYILDGIVILIILGFALRAYNKGLIGAGLSFLPMLCAMGAAYFVAPVCGRLFRQTPLFHSLQSTIFENLHLDTLAGSAVTASQTQLIEQMQLPIFLKNALLENNNPVVYDILNAERLQDYIAGFLANMSVNILSVIVVFIITFIIVKLFLNALNLVFKLPVLSFFNRLCGLIIGTVQGILAVWITCTILTFFYSNPKIAVFWTWLELSHVAKLFYENNLLLLIILKIFA